MPAPARAARPALLLVDNGSLEPAATLNLRAIATALGRRLGREVTPVSLLHSSTIPAGRLGGRRAEILAPTLARRLRGGGDDFLVVPLFFGPSAALTEYLPRRVAALRRKFPRLRVRVAPPLVDPGAPRDRRLVAILAERVRQARPGGQGVPAVILVDHGSPVRAVAAMRDQLASQLRLRLGTSVRRVRAASMERRPGARYAFAEPLLGHAFDERGYTAGPVIVALLFLFPGRHAGPRGDVARICAAARKRHPRLQPIMTEPVGSHPGLISILADRVRAGLAAPPL